MPLSNLFKYSCQLLAYFAGIHLIGASLIFMDIDFVVSSLKYSIEPFIFYVSCNWFNFMLSLCYLPGELKERAATKSIYLVLSIINVKFKLYICEFV